MKIFVVGASGLIGSHLYREAKLHGWNVVGTFKTFSLAGLILCDCSDTARVEMLLHQEQPDAVVHAAGWTWVDGCEDNPQRAFAENAKQPGHLAELCKNLGIHFTYVSTSYIFDGKNGPYSEDAAPNPINVYGRSKLEGEQTISRVSDGKALIARSICAYGPEPQKKGFAYQIWRAMESGATLSLPCDQCGNPTYAGDVARWLIELIEKHAAGIFHLAGPNPNCTRVEWAEKLIHAFQKAGVERHPAFSIKAIPTVDLKQKALRPLQAGLLTSHEFDATDFNESICELIQRDAKNL